MISLHNGQVEKEKFVMGHSGNAFCRGIFLNVSIKLLFGRGGILCFHE